MWTSHRSDNHKQEEEMSCQKKKKNEDDHGRRRRHIIRKQNISSRSHSSCRPIYLILASLFLCLQSNLLGQQPSSSSSSFFVQAQANQVKPKYTDEPFSTGNRHRQNVCPQFQKFKQANGTSELSSALAGMEINVLLNVREPYPYVEYSEEDGLASYPGIIPVILDEVARRGGFTWRNSFGALAGLDLDDYNKTWTELLLWGIDNYDIFGDTWSKTFERMDLGAVYMTDIMDSSMILLTKAEWATLDAAPAPYAGNMWNWLRPFDARVWGLTLFTIFLSAIIYMILEWYADEREERTFLEWFWKNFYHSFLGATQEFRFEPKSFSGRMFVVSLAIWALVMTATYTANLASLLVQRPDAPPKPQTMPEIAVRGLPVCVWEGNVQTERLQETYELANLVPRKDEIALYGALNNRECEYLLAFAQDWLRLQNLHLFNPDCDIEWVGRDRRVFTSGAGFVASADSGDLCTGFIRDVFDFHLKQMVEDGFVEKSWAIDNKRYQDHDCTAVQEEEEEPDTRRQRKLLRSTKQEHVSPSTTYNNGPRHRHQDQRKLGGSKGAAGGAVAATASSDWSVYGQLGLDAMIGIFVFHWVFMGVALAIANIDVVYQKYGRKHVHKFVGALVTESYHTVTSKSKRKFEEDKPDYLENPESSSVDNIDGIEKSQHSENRTATSCKPTTAVASPSTPSARNVATSTLPSDTPSTPAQSIDPEILEAMLRKQDDLQLQVQMLCKLVAADRGVAYAPETKSFGPFSKGFFAGFPGDTQANADMANAMFNDENKPNQYASPGSQRVPSLASLTKASGHGNNNTSEKMKSDQQPQPALDKVPGIASLTIINGNTGRINENKPEQHFQPGHEKVPGIPSLAHGNADRRISCKPKKPEQHPQPKFEKVPSKASLATLATANGVAYEEEKKSEQHTPTRSSDIVEA